MFVLTDDGYLVAPSSGPGNRALPSRCCRWIDNREDSTIDVSVELDASPHC